MNLTTLKIEKPKAINLILGQTHSLASPFVGLVSFGYTLDGV